MANKIELKKTIVSGIIAFLIISLVFSVANYIEYRKYTEAFNIRLSQMIKNINAEYPKVDISEIMQALNNKDYKERDILKEYGIDINSDSAIIENDKHFQKFLICEISIFFILFIVISFIFLRYNKDKDKKLKDITKYIEQINRRNYKLDIEDNTEDELSILKNEVYKTTVMLKEVAENSMQDKLKLKDSLSDISHQLKTPLTSINIMLDNMLENKQMDINTREEFVKDIKREVINLNFLVNSLLKLSKFDANTIEFINKNEKISNILYEAKKNVAGLCDLKNVEIHIEGEENSEINCDFKWQVEAITNILKNCVEHSFENSKIDISYNQNKLYSKIEIRDYGTGIDEKDLPHIFERFYKGKNSSDNSVRNRSCT